jgi:hypothetical protein
LRAIVDEQPNYLRTIASHRQVRVPGALQQLATADKIGQGDHKLTQAPNLHAIVDEQPINLQNIASHQQVQVSGPVQQLAAVNKTVQQGQLLTQAPSLYLIPDEQKAFNLKDLAIHQSVLKAGVGSRGQAFIEEQPQTESINWPGEIERHNDLVQALLTRVGEVRQILSFSPAEELARLKNEIVQLDQQRDHKNFPKPRLDALIGHISAEIDGYLSKDSDPLTPILKETLADIEAFEQMVEDDVDAFMQVDYDAWLKALRQLKLQCAEELDSSQKSADAAEQINADFDAIRDRIAKVLPSYLAS